MQEIELTKGAVALVDDEDAELVRQYRWYLLKSDETHWYAARSAGTQIVLMHRFLLDAPRGRQVDHRNGDGLDNQRANLRLATPAQNQQNQRLSRNNTSGFKGVHWKVADQKWIAQIRVDGEHFHLGSYDSPEEAARAHDRMAVRAFGEFASTNESLGLLVAA